MNKKKLDFIEKPNYPKSSVQVSYYIVVQDSYTRLYYLDGLKIFLVELSKYNYVVRHLNSTRT